MTNIGIINYGSYGAYVQNSEDIEIGTKVFSFGDFVIYKKCNPEEGYMISEIDIKDDPLTNNSYITSQIFEGVEFLSEKYSSKKITLKIYFFEENGKTYDDIIEEIKDNFAPIKGEIEFFYRGEIMKLKVIKESLKFNLKDNFKSFTITFISKPFFESSVKHILSGSISGTNGLIKISNNGNRIYPKLSLKINGNGGGLTLGNSIGKVRYIRDSMDGSMVNSGNHWVEIEAIEKFTNINIALNKNVDSNGLNGTGNQDRGRIVNGNIDSENYYSAGDGLKYVKIDLGGIYDLEKIHIWHYYNDNRIYHKTKTEVSVDGINWITIFDSNEEGTYKETSEGRTYFLEDRIFSIEGKRIITENLNNGDNILFDFKSGKVFRNGVYVKTNGTLPKLWKNSEIFINSINKIVFPQLDQLKNSMEGTTGSGVHDITYSSNYYRCGHLFENHGINFLKKVRIYGSNMFAYSVRMNVKLYTGTNRTTLIREFEKIVYGGNNYNYQDFEITGEGLDLSSNSTIYLDLQMSCVPSVASSIKFYELERSVTGTGKSYNKNMTSLDFNWKFELFGNSTPYSSTNENISSIDYILEYFDNYL